MGSCRRAAAVLIAACCLPAAALAQQGTLQVSAAAHAISGDPERIGTERTFEPDAGVSWIRPGTRFGTLQIELRGTSRGDTIHLGRTYVALTGLRARGFAWSFEGGDAFFTPGASSYRFTNLATPAVTFAGAAISARSPLTDLSVVVGRTTAWTNIFGTDPETLNQRIAVARGRHTFNSRVEVTSRASRIRSGEPRAFRTNVAESDQAGGGVRVTVVPQLQVVGDASTVWFRRDAAGPREHDGSGLLGAHVLLARGWFEANVSRFSPGELPIVNQPLSDRQTFFAAGEYDVVKRLRAFGGSEEFRTNLAPDASGSAVPETRGRRGFGGFRTALGERGTLSFRFESGDRKTRYFAATRTSISDSGSASAEWQASTGRLTTFARYARRENVEIANADATYTQHDVSTQLFARLTTSMQVFGNVTATRSLAESGAGSTFWQTGGGAQGQIGGRGLWLRSEFNTSRNLDLLTDALIPRDSLLLGITGDIARRLTLGLNVYADRVTTGHEAHGSWVARTTVRLTRTFATGPTIAGAGPGSAASVVRAAGSGSIMGTVFRDWNSNGIQDADEDALEGIPVRVGTIARASTARDGGFAFVSVPVGLQAVGLDTSTLPVEFDLPLTPEIQVELSRGATRHVRFGLVPLGDIRGRVIHDTNGNGRADTGEPSIDGAVLVLDGGARSEQVRKGQYRFEAVRAGSHTLALLIDSLPEGSSIAGESEQTITLAKGSLDSEASWLVTIQPRAEIRRVFPGPAGAPQAAPTLTTRPADAPAAPQYAVQVTALTDVQRARALVRELVDAGFRAYLIEPALDDATVAYRVRVGRFSTFDSARRAAVALERLRGEKLLVVREVRER